MMKRVVVTLAAAMGVAAGGVVSAEAGGAWPGFDGQSMSIEAGGLVAVMPRFEGSKSYVVRGLPFAYPTFGGPDSDSNFQISGVDDIRYRLLKLNGFEVGPLAGWRFGRKDDDADHLHGLGDVNGGLIVGAYAAYRMGSLLPYVSYHHQVTGDDTGGILRFGVEAKQRLTPWLKLTANGGATWASSQYMESFFGVTAAQSLRTGGTLTQFDATSGIKDAFISLTADFRIDDQWGVKVFGRYARLVGDAADSPITETPNQFLAGAAVTYRFTLGP